MKPIQTDVIDNGQYGSLLYAAEFDQSPSVLPPEALNGRDEPLPKRVTLHNLPAIAMQGTPAGLGSPGSCEAQSFGYCLGSYTAARKPDGSVRWNPELIENQISAAYLYAWAHQKEGRSCPKGSLAIPYLNRLIAVGAPDFFQVPYYPVCCYLSAIDPKTEYPNAGRFRLGSLAAFNISKDPTAAILLIKKLVAAGHAVAFSGPVLTGYSNPLLEDGVFCVTTTIPNSGHGQTVVGYDDEVGPKDNRGAFLIQNSFGTIWPPDPTTSIAPPGRLYWSYTTFQTQSLAATAYPLKTGPLTGVRLTSAGEPSVSVNRAYQWAPKNGAGVWLIVLLQFEWAVTLNQVILTEPKTGTTITGQYNANINNGYVYFQRTDGNQFVAGDWQLQLIAEDLSGTEVSYAGTLKIEASSPASPPAAVVNVNTPITDTTGAAASIMPGLT